MKLKSIALQLLLFLFCCSLHAQWQSLGPNGGVVRDLIYAEGSFWAVTNAGVFQSADGGLSWQYRPSTLPRTYTALRIASSEERVFVYFLGPSFPRYLFTSDDGNSWIDLPMTPDSLYNAQLYGYDTTCLALTIYNLWRLDNLTLTWSAVEVPAQANGLSAIEHSDHALYLTAFNGVWRQQDGSSEWTSISLPAGGAGLFHAHSDQLWFSESTWQNMATSVNQGQSWQNTFWNTTVSPDMTQVIWADSTFYGIRAYNLARSTEGMLWEFPVVGPPPYLDRIAAGEGVLVFGGQGGFYRSANGGNSIESSNEGFVGTSVGTMEVHGGAVYIPNISKRDPNTGLWESVHNGFHLVSIGSMARSNGYSFAVTTSGTKTHSIVRSSTDWVTLETIDSRGGNSYGRFLSSGLKLYTVLSGFTCLAHRLDNDGTSVVNITEKITSQLGVYVNTLAPVGTDVVAASSGNLPTFYISHDEGETWETFESSWDVMPSMQTYLNFINVGEILFAQYGTKLYRSEDHGAHWSLPIAGLPDYLGFVTDIISTGANLLMATDKAGVFLSTDNGISWTEFNAGIGIVVAEDLQVDEDYVYLATTGHGVWRIGLDQVTSIASNPLSENEIIIFPNPAHSGFYLSTPDHQPVTGTVMIYNLSGQLIYSGKLDRNTFLAFGNQIPKGLHMVQVIQEKKIYSTKLIVE